ncbi:MAG: hypothetical protein O3C40_32130 [Planctomycetota bacterium]|nr:hypothetical protein [Planctomycetota bacterium]
MSKPCSGASIVFSAEPVLAARAIALDQVVVAVGSGAVKVLQPSGDRFVVTSVLQAQSGTPLVPSALVVLPNASGQFQVLVNSQGSDTVAVFSVATQLRTPVSIFVPVSATFSNASTSASGLALSAASSSTNATSGWSLSSFSALSGFRATDSSVAGLVSFEGNSYSAVPLLDFGSLRDDDDGDGRERMPMRIWSMIPGTRICSSLRSPASRRFGATMPTKNKRTTTV